MEIQKGVQRNAKCYVVIDNDGRRLSIERNYRVPNPRPELDTSEKYYLVAQSNKVGVRMSFTEDQMLEFFAAFLAVKQEYEVTDGD